MPLGAIAQQQGKLWRVGALFLSSAPLAAPFGDALKRGMRELGWVEGKNLEYRFAYADGQVERLESLARELVEQKVDVIVTSSAPVILAAQKATRSIPIVTTNANNPVENKFVASLVKPGGNITGVTYQFETILGKVIEALHEVAPRARRIAVLVNDSIPAHGHYWTSAQAACAILKLVPLRFAANSPAQLEAAIGQMVRQKAEGIVVVADALFVNQRAQLEKLIRATRLPAAYGLPEHVIEGGLISYGASPKLNYGYAASFVSRILKGAKPADLPMEQPSRFSLAINLKTAKALGLAIPQVVMLRADEVIE